MRLAARAAPFAGVALAAAAAGGCGTLHSGAVAETGPCAQVIPIAQARAGRDAVLIHARALKRGDLSRVLDSLGLQREVKVLERRRRRREARRRTAQRVKPVHHPERRTPLPRVSCLLVYRGSFHATNATHRHLVLVIRVRHPVVFAAVSLDTLPRAVARES